MMLPQNIHLKDYNYSLPKDKIAEFPLEQRDHSKLLIWDKNQIKENVFSRIQDLISENSLVIFNKTKVIQARLIFQKKTGANIEIFCLEPDDEMDIRESFQQTVSCKWKCFIGNSAKWKSGTLSKKFSIKGTDYILFAERVEKINNTSVIKFSWQSQTLTFAEILDNIGLIPLPPYIEREAVDSDKIRYQTIFARQDGSVAAPTAGLHFTENSLKKLEEKNIECEYITLHVGAGTFKPVVSETIERHEMHTEKIIVDKNTIIHILQKHNRKKIIAVGTTTMRTLESLYWFGVKLIKEKDKTTSFVIHQWDAYENNAWDDIPVQESLSAVLDFMNENKLNFLQGSTQMMIVPGYQFKIADGLITNFHQPQSTLLLLIAAFIGESWKNLYNYALENNYRFLSYGDCCLFFR